MSRVLGQETVIGTLTVVILQRLSKTFLLSINLVERVDRSDQNLAAPFAKTVLKIDSEFLLYFDGF